MRRYWVAANYIQGSEVRFEGDSFKHIFVVCRQDVGSKFEVLSEGIAYFVEVTEKSKKTAVAKIVSQRELPELPKPYIRLVLSLPKFSTFEAVLEKSVELGVSEVTPFFSEFSFVRSKEKIGSKKRERWEKIALGATQQTGRGELMKISEPVDLETLLRNFSALQKEGTVNGVFAFEGEGQSTVKEAIQGLEGKDLQEIWLFVGGEGGFSSQETQFFQKFNLFPVTLGPQVLRVETACVTLLAILKYELGHMR